MVGSHIAVGKERRPLLVFIVLVAAVMLQFALTPIAYGHQQNQVDFVKKWSESAQKAGIQYGLPYEVALSQAGVESQWGTSTLTTQYYNFHGIKAVGNQPYVEMATRECANICYATTAKFRKFENAEEGFKGWFQFLKDNPRYAAAFDHPTDPKKVLEIIANAGYATDPNYYQTCLKVLTEIQSILQDNNIKSSKELGIKKGGSGASAEVKDTTEEVKDEKKGTKDKQTTEDELTGMPERYNYADDDTAILDVPSGKDLSMSDRYALSMLNSENEMQTKAATERAIRIGIMVIGFIIFGYSVLVGMAIMFDRANTVFEFSLLSVVTMGSLNLVSNRFDEGKSRVTTKKALQLVAIGFVVSAVVLSGVYYGWAVEVWWWLQDTWSHIGEYR